MHCAHCPASFPEETPPPAATRTRAKKSRPRRRVARPWVYVGVALAAVLTFASFRGRRAIRSSTAPNARFNPTADADRDIQDGIARAKVTQRRVLVVVGGNWCLRCRRMEEFFNANPDLAELRDREFVAVYVSVTPERSNRAVLSRYPAVPSYPHLFVLDDFGGFVASQDVRELEARAQYDRYRVETFLRGHARPPKTPEL